jgi:hypothetical protein
VPGSAQFIQSADLQWIARSCPSFGPKRLTSKVDVANPRSIILGTVTGLSDAALAQVRFRLDALLVRCEMKFSATAVAGQLRASGRINDFPVLVKADISRRCYDRHGEAARQFLIAIVPLLG